MRRSIDRLKEGHAPAAVYIAPPPCCTHNLSRKNAMNIVKLSGDGKCLHSILDGAVIASSAVKEYCLHNKKKRRGIRVGKNETVKTITSRSHNKNLIILFEPSTCVIIISI